MASKGTAVPSSGSAGWLESLGTLPDAPILFYGRPILRQSWSEGKRFVHDTKHQHPFPIRTGRNARGRYKSNVVGTILRSRVRGVYIQDWYVFLHPNEALTDPKVGVSTAKRRRIHLCH